MRFPRPTEHHRRVHAAVSRKDYAGNRHAAAGPMLARPLCQSGIEYPSFTGPTRHKTRLFALQSIRHAKGCHQLPRDDPDIQVARSIQKVAFVAPSQ